MEYTWDGKEDWSGKTFKGDFTVGENVTSLKGCPEIIKGWFTCNGCKELLTLEGSPEIVEGSFDCSNCNNLTSLKGIPKEIGKTFKCIYNFSNELIIDAVPHKLGFNFNEVALKLNSPLFEIDNFKSVSKDVIFELSKIKNLEDYLSMNLFLHIKKEIILIKKIKYYFKNFEDDLLFDNMNFVLKAFFKGEYI